MAESTYTGMPATTVTYSEAAAPPPPPAPVYAAPSTLPPIQTSHSAETASNYDPSVTDADVNKNRGVRGFWNKMTQPFKYQSKNKFQNFEHDNASLEDINLLRCFHTEYMNMSSTVDALVDTEKNYSVATLRQATRLNEIVQPANTSCITEQMKAWVELELQLAQLHSNWVGENLIELQNMLKLFNKQNIKEAKIKKHALNVAAMNRSDYNKAHLKTVDKESKRYFDEKHDEMGVRLSEERKNIAHAQYEQAAKELEQSIQGLYEFERITVLEQMKKFLNSKKQYHDYCLNLINLSSDKINSFPLANVQLPYEKNQWRHTQILTQQPVEPTISVGRDIKYEQPMTQGAKYEQPMTQAAFTPTPNQQIPTA